MQEILYLKFTQNEDLCQFLLATGEKSLHEATNSSYWAIGVELYSKALENRTWAGQNTLGHLLMDLRQNLRASNVVPQSGTPNTNNDQANDYLNVKPMSEDEESEHGDELQNTTVVPDQSDLDSLHPPPAISQPPKPVSMPPKSLPATQNKESIGQQVNPTPTLDRPSPENNPPAPSSPAQDHHMRAPNQAHSTPKPWTKETGPELRTTADYFSLKQNPRATGCQTDLDSSLNLGISETRPTQVTIRKSHRVNKKP